MSTTTYSLGHEHISVVDGPHRLITTGVGFTGHQDVKPTLVGTVLTFGRESDPESAPLIRDFEPAENQADLAMK